MNTHLRILLILLLSGLVSFQLVAQDEPVDLPMVYKIKQEGLQRSKVMDIAFYLTDVAGPRLTNSPGYDRAAEWAKEEFEKWGLKNVALESWGEFGKGWENQKLYVAMTSPYYQPLIAAAKAWTPGTKGKVKGELVYLEINSEEDFDKYRGKIKGKAVLLKPSSEIETSFEADASRLTDEELDDMAKQPMGRRSGNRRYSPERIAEWRKLRALREKVNAFLAFEGASLIIQGCERKRRNPLYRRRTWLQNQCR